MMSSSGESSDDEGSSKDVVFTSTTAVGRPYSRFQGSYLSNLQKLLNEADQTGISDIIRFSPKISNALEINWQRFDACFDRVHPVLVQYKLSRASNRVECVRPTMNRKLREWNFHMVCTCTEWVSYIYESAAFSPTVNHGQLPTRRRTGCT